MGAETKIVVRVTKLPTEDIEGVMGADTKIIVRVTKLHTEDIEVFAVTKPEAYRSILPKTTERFINEEKVCQ